MFHPAGPAPAVQMKHISGRCYKRARYKDNCFVYADKIFICREKIVARGKKLCYDFMH